MDRPTAPPIRKLLSGQLVRTDADDGLRTGYASARLYNPAPHSDRTRIRPTDKLRLETACYKRTPIARSGILQAQERQQKQANKHRRPVDFQVGNKVYVSTKTWNKDQPSHKLDHQMAGPYTILEQVGHAYRLELPPAIKIHPVISADKLRKAADDPLPAQIQEP
ncbi:hypothetical protein V502_01610, partial [Pseudogymnoascus sp. VKM F-4520 (FW-2644)]